MSRSIDDRIKEALGYHEAADPQSNEATALQLVGDTIRGRHRTLATIAAIFTFAMFAVMVYAAVQMFQAPELRETVLWAVGVMWGALSVAMLKMWFWMQMGKYSLMREIKRLEAQVARLGERLAP